MFDDNSGKFKVKVRSLVKVQYNLSNNRQKCNASSVNSYSPTWTMLLSGEITNMLSVGLEAKLFAKQILKKFGRCILSVFWPSTKSSNQRKPENNSLPR